MKKLALFAVVFGAFFGFSQETKAILSSEAYSDTRLTIRAEVDGTGNSNNWYMDWDSKNVSSCTASGDWSDAIGVSGSKFMGNGVFFPPGPSKLYIISCAGSLGGAVKDTAARTEVPGSTLINFTVTGTLNDANGGDPPNTVFPGQNVGVSWSTQDVGDCTASGDWSGSKGLSGNETIGVITGSKTFILTCLYNGPGNWVPQGTPIVGGAVVNLYPSGKVRVQATNDGVSWNGSLTVQMFGTTNSGGYYTVNTPSYLTYSGWDYFLVGSYDIFLTSGGPFNQVLSSVTPIDSQIVSDNSTIVFTFNFVSPPLTVSCSASPNPQRININATWSANVSGGAGSYTYSWSGTDGLTGTTQSVTKSYTTTGTKTASVAVTSGSKTQTVNCSNLTVNDNKLLTVTKNIAAGGTVSSAPAGINCGTGCPNQSALFANNTPVSLTATFAAGYSFSGWSGDADCSDGNVTMSADKTCTANFTLLNASPVVVAGISLNTTSFDSIINVKKGVSTTLYISAWRGTQSGPPPTSKSDDPNGWTNASLGMSGGSAKCEFANDLIQDPSFFVPGMKRDIPPNFSECSDPDTNASNYITLIKTFNDTPGTYTYYVLKMTDRAGGVSDPLGTVQVKVLAQCEDGLDNDGDGKIDFSGGNPDPGCSSATDDNEVESQSDLTISVNPSLNTGIPKDGNTLTFKGTVRNQGLANAGGNFENHFQIDLNNDGSVDIDLIPDTNIPNLAVGSSEEIVSGNWTAIQGTHRIILCSDNTNKVNESDETNNCSPSGTGLITINPSLSVALTAFPQAGNFPLNTELTAEVSGSAQGTINYSFWWNCNNPTTSVQDAITVCGDPSNSSNGVKLDNRTETTISVSHIYTAENIYYAKVIVERGSADPQEARVSINASCVDECSSSQCVAKGPTGKFKTCGNYDGDSCLELSPNPISCGAGQTCIDGVCKLVPVISFNAAPPKIKKDDSTILSWTVNNVDDDDCVASNSENSLQFTGVKSASGSASVSPTVNTEYTLICTNVTGTASQTVTVEIDINPGPGEF